MAYFGGVINRSDFFARKRKKVGATTRLGNSIRGSNWLPHVVLGIWIQA